MKPRLSPEERRLRRQELRRRAMHRSKFALPSGITLLSVLCGFSSVVMSLNGVADNSDIYFRWAALFLILAAFFDGMDGRVARLTNTATEFGVQLDSLADVVSFGMAPAILAYCYGFFHLGVQDHHLRAVGWAASFFFIACGALRLARFNVQVGAVDSRFFMGMPIPVGAAGIAVVSLGWPHSLQTSTQAYFFSVGLFLISLLMVSTVRFPSFKKRTGNPNSIYWALVSTALLASLAIMLQWRFFAGFYILYVSATLLLNLGWLVGWRGVQPPRDEDAEDTVH